MPSNRCDINLSDDESSENLNVYIQEIKNIIKIVLKNLLNFLLI